MSMACNRGRIPVQDEVTTALTAVYTYAVSVVGGTRSKSYKKASTSRCSWRVIPGSQSLRAPCPPLAHATSTFLHPIAALQ